MRLLLVSLAACLRAIACGLIVALIVSDVFSAAPPPSRPVRRSEAEAQPASEPTKTSTPATPNNTTADNQTPAPSKKGVVGSGPRKEAARSSNGIRQMSHAATEVGSEASANNSAPANPSEPTNDESSKLSLADELATADSGESYWWIAPHKRSFRVRAEHLQWWTTGMNVPPLITSSPVGTPVNQAGVLGLPSTTVRYGGNEQLSDSRAGGRYVASMWLDHSSVTGLELEYFGIFPDAQQFDASPTTGILARPFVNALTSQQDAKFIAYPNVLTGSATVEANSQLHSASARLRHDLLDWNRAFNDAFSSPLVTRWSATAGYRYMELSEDLSVSEDLVDPNIPATIHAFDRFDTNNQLHAAELGLIAEFEAERWSCDLDLKLALGLSRQSVNIQGSTNTTAMGVPASYVGSLFAQSSNIGQHDRDKFAIVPQLGMTVGYRIFDQLKLFAGYRMLYWSDVVRPGDQMDLAINPTLIPPAMPPGTGPQRPHFEFQEQSFFAHALSLGLEFVW